MASAPGSTSVEGRQLAVSEWSRRTDVGAALQTSTRRMGSKLAGLGFNGLGLGLGVFRVAGVVVHTSEFASVGCCVTAQ